MLIKVINKRECSDIITKEASKLQKLMYEELAKLRDRIIALQDEVQIIRRQIN